jgi:hypothetical protein
VCSSDLDMEEIERELAKNKDDPSDP